MIIFKWMQTLHLYIVGRVQGVGYRMSTEIEAKQLGLTGWVRNLSDGRVEIMAQGKKEKLQAFEAWCHQGPPLACVDHVVANWIDQPAQYETFTTTATL